MLVCLLLAFGTTSCGGHSQSFVPPSNAASANASFGVAYEPPQGKLPSPIQHVVIIFQENRTPDYLFQGVAGADISKTATDSKGDKVSLHEVSLAAPYDLGHSHQSFVQDYDGGKLDGFDHNQRIQDHLHPYGYAPRSEVQPYLDMASRYVFADHMFQSNQGPSFPAHLYIVSGTATQPSIGAYRVSDNPIDRATLKSAGGGCDARPTVVVNTVEISDGSAGPRPYPCFDRPVLSDFLDAKKVSWRFYQQELGPGLWHPFDAIRHVRNSPEYANVVTPPQTVLTDIANGHLAGMSWVMPDGKHSDHAGSASAEGPSWVAAVVNAVGKSKYWNSTAIFVAWDDWGGWYDHVPPPIFNHYELGFRVPLLVISPYAKRGYVSKVQHEFASILVFAEQTFGIPRGSLDSTDTRADDLMDAFDFTQKPRPFVPIDAPPFRPANGPNAEDP